VAAGRRRCANCGARLKDFAPVPLSSVSNITSSTPAASPDVGHSTTTPAAGAASAAATRSLVFSLLPFAAAVVAVALAVALSFWILAVDSDSDAVIAPVLLLFAVTLAGFVAGAVFVVISVRSGVRGLAETASGDTTGRGRSVAGITISSLVALVLVVSLVGFVVSVASAG
jgi:hypothetical protein